MKTPLILIALLLASPAIALPIGVVQRYDFHYANPNGDYANGHFWGNDSGGQIVTTLGSGLTGWEIQEGADYLSTIFDNYNGSVAYNGAFEITAFNLTGITLPFGRLLQFRGGLDSARGTQWTPAGGLNQEIIDLTVFGQLTITAPGGFLLTAPLVEANGVSAPEAGETIFLLAMGLGSLMVVYRRRVTAYLLGWL